MAQTGYTPISIYYSSTATNVPTAGNLVAGELAINTADGKLFYKDSSGVVQVIGTKGGVGSSSTTQVLYNSSGLVVGSANMTFNGTSLTLANDASISGLTVGKGSGSINTNTALGSAALGANSAGVTGASNTAVGANALWNITSGTDNSTFGRYAGISLTTGGFNTAIGSNALYSNTIASNNTAVGCQALYANTDVSNTAVGFSCLNSLSASSAAGGNTAIGNQAGTNKTGGYQCIYIGTGVVGASATTFAEIVIGSSGSAGKGSSTGFINPNSGGVYQGNNSAAWSITSDQRLKKNIVDNTVGLDAISKIQVRNFEYRTADEVTELEPQNAIDIKGVQLGAIAQELQAILPECVKTESTGVMSVDATNLTWYLINAVKELNAKVTALEAQLSKP